jgi:hypothetical protein
MADTPVAYIVFNRPRHTQRTFGVLREQRPRKLYIIADGPRPGRPDDVGLCKAVRSIIEHVDWPCEVQRNYSEVNLGLKRRVSSGLGWVFEQEDRAIVLEDDCLPHRDFFVFCDTLLERYAEDERVAVITGNNFQAGRWRGRASYYFSKYNHCWGWATWRRAWHRYDGGLSFWPQWRESRGWRQQVSDPVERHYWEGIFCRVHMGEIDSWAYPWTGSTWYHGGLTATPNVNLVSNIGFGPDGTHTLADTDRPGLATMALGTLTHPTRVACNHKADRFVFDQHFGGQRLRQRWRESHGLLALPKRLLRGVTRRLLTR